MYRKKNSISLFILILVLLISCDPLTGPKNEPPFLFNVFPPDGSSNVPIDIKITAGFSEKIDMSTLKKGFIMKPENSDEPLILRKVIDSESSDSIAMAPKKPLEHNTSYICELNENITDPEGKPLRNPIKWSFTTTTESIDTTVADTIPPKIISVIPEDKDTGITVDPEKINIQFEFNEPIIATDSSSFLMYYWDGALPSWVKIEVEINNNIATIKPVDSLKYNTLYAVGVGPSLSDSNGNKYDKTKYWEFTTKKDPTLWRLPEYYIATQVTTLNSDNKIYISARKYTHQTWLGPNSYKLRSFFIRIDKSGKLELKKEIGLSWGGSIDSKEDWLENNILSPNSNYLYFYNKLTSLCKINKDGQKIWCSGYVGNGFVKDNQGNIYDVGNFLHKLDPDGNLLEGMNSGNYNVTDMGFLENYIITFGFYNDVPTLGKLPQDMRGFQGVIKFPNYSDGKIIDEHNEIYMINEESDSIALYNLSLDTLFAKWSIKIELNNVIQKTQDDDGNLYFLEENNSEYRLTKISRSSTKEFEINLGKRPGPHITEWNLSQGIHNTLYIPWGREILRFDTQTGQRIRRYE